MTDGARSSGDGDAPRAFYVASPRTCGRLFAMTDIGHLVLGDTALAHPFALEAFLFYAQTQEVARIDFWGRASRLYADRAMELLQPSPTTLQLRSYARFEPIDLLEDASEIASARRRDTGYSVLDRQIPLEQSMIKALHDTPIRLIVE